MRKLYSSILLSLGVCTLASAQFTGITGPTNQGGVGVLPATGGIGQVFTLTQATNHYGQAKGVWANASVNLSAPFSVCANLNFGSFNETNNADPLADWAGPVADRQRSGADGIAFVLSKATASGGVGSYVGETGEEMGYGTSFYAGGPAPDGFTPRDAIAVEIDTWQNDGATHGARNLFDPVQDHMAIMRRGSTVHGTANGITNSTPVVLLPEMETGAAFPIKLTWDPVTGLRAELNNNPLWVVTASVADVLASLNAATTNVNVNWGFNSATGQAANLQTVQVVNCVVTPPPCALTVDVTLPALSCDDGNTIYIGYGPQSVTATSNQAGTTFQWFKVGPPDVLVGTGATFTPTEPGSYYVVATNGNCTATTQNTADVITVIDIRCGKENQDKVYVCHKKNGEHGNGTIGDNAHTLCVSVNAVPAHLAHGDCLGECPEVLRPGTAGPGGNTTTQQAPEDAVSQETISVYPNPSRGQVQLSLSAATLTSQVYIINSRGTVVEKRTVGNINTLTLDLKKYGVGVYMVKVVSGKTEQTTKVIVQD